MAFVAAFTIAQSALSPGSIIAEDTHTGVDATVTVRHIYVQTTSGEYLVATGVVTDYNVWPLVTNPITLDLLTEDQAVSIRVDWLNVSGTVLYTLTQQYCLAEYNKVFMYYLQQLQSLTPGIVQDTDYYSNMVQFYATIVGAVNAVEVGDDIQASQNCLNRGTYMRLNESLFF